jgi:hypothetical protein
MGVKSTKDDNKLKAILANGDKNLVVTDNTGNDVSTSAHGFCPKAPNDKTKFLMGDGTCSTPNLFTRATSADFTTTSTTVVTITGLSQALLASSVYEVEIHLVAKSSTAAGIKVGFNCSAAITKIEMIEQLANITGGAEAAPNRITAIPALSAAILLGVNDIGLARYKGIIETNGACTLNAQMLKVTSGTATCFIDSFMKATKVA